MRTGAHYQPLQTVVDALRGAAVEAERDLFPFVAAVLADGQGTLEDEEGTLSRAMHRVIEQAAAAATHPMAVHDDDEDSPELTVIHTLQTVDNDHELRDLVSWLKYCSE